MRGPVLLALLLLALPPLAPAAMAQQRPSLSIVQGPAYTADDAWTYRVTLLGTNNTSLTQNQTVRVTDIGPLDGTQAVRTFTQSMRQSELADRAGRSAISEWSNKTVWSTAQGQRILRIEEESDRIQDNPLFRVASHIEVNWTFHSPMDVYQFPILKGEQWIVETNATVTRNVSFQTTTGPNTTNTSQPTGTFNVTQRSGTEWLRQDVCGPANNCTTAGTFDVVVLVSRSGNTTIFDFWSPAVGNLVRREILNETGQLLETSVLTSYRFQQAPAPPPPPAGSGPNLPLLAGAAMVGVLAGAAAVQLWRRRAPAVPPPGEPAAPPPPAAPQEPGPVAPPPEAPPSAPPEGPPDEPPKEPSTSGPEPSPP
jgi:hypothetical protein